MRSLTSWSLEEAAPENALAEAVIPATLPAWRDPITYPVTKLNMAKVYAGDSETIGPSFRCEVGRPLDLIRIIGAAMDDEILIPKIDDGADLSGTSRDGGFYDIENLLIDQLASNQ